MLLGAFGAHALRGVLDVQSRELWHTAVNYHVWHALALALAVGLGRGRSRRIAIAEVAFGIALFSGSLYALAGGVSGTLRLVIGAPTPLGGLALILAWCAAAAGIARTVASPS